MRCAECGKRFDQGEKICVDDDDMVCMDCLEDKVWLRHGTEEIAKALEYEISRYKRIERPAQPVPIPVIQGQVYMF